VQKCRIQSCLFGFVCTTKSLRATTAQSRAGTSSRDKVARQNRAMNRRCDVGLSRGGAFYSGGGGRFDRIRRGGGVFTCTNSDVAVEQLGSAAGAAGSAAWLATEKSRSCRRRPSASWLARCGGSSLSSVILMRTEREADIRTDRQRAQLD